MKKKVIIIICLLVIALYTGFKLYCYKRYGQDMEVSSVKITGKMTINHIDLDDSEYITFENLKFKDVFEGYERLDSEANAYKMVFKTDEVNRAIFIGSDEPFVSIINNNKDYSTLSNIIKKENINDDLDLVKYMDKHNDDKVSFFMTTSKQKQIYSLNEFKQYTLPSIIYTKEVDGYYRGYLFKTSEDITDINILKDNKKYYFTFIGDYTEEFINDFMNSVIVE